MSITAFSNEAGVCLTRSFFDEKDENLDVTRADINFPIVTLP